MCYGTNVCRIQKPVVISIRGCWKSFSGRLDESSERRADAHRPGRQADEKEEVKLSCMRVEIEAPQHLRPHLYLTSLKIPALVEV